ncbi:restriction endonuclease subunit S [Treponema sp. R8-4-B8]
MLEGYGEYKEINLPWLHSIPKKWVSVKIGELFEERKVKVSDKKYAPLTVGKMGVVPQLSTVAKSNDSDNRKLVKYGDYVINSRSDRKGSSGLSSLDGSVSLINIVLTPREGSGKYYHYLLRSYYWIEEYYRNGRGIVADLWTTRFSEMKSIVLPIPPRPEQDQIVHYLDWKVSMINKYINAKKKQIELLKERKQAIINQAVTKGLDMNVPMKDSGIEWLRKIPSHWEEKPIRSIAKLSNKRRGNRKDLELLSVYREYGVIKKDSRDDNRNVESEDLTNYKYVKKGNLVLNKMKMWQGSLGISDYEGIVSPAYIVCDLFTEDNLTFLQFLLRSPIFKTFYNQVSYGIRVGQWDMHYEDFKSLRLFIPPRSEQDQIVNYLEKKISMINKYIDENNGQIDLLQEYRTRIISDVVTGKVNVQNVKVPEIENEIENEELSDNEKETEEGVIDDN